MIPGRVVRFRLMPKDCLSVLDILERAGISTVGKSYNTMCHLAMSSMLDTFRSSGIINPEPDPFQYSERMATFLDGAQANERRRVTKELRQASLSGTIATPRPLAVYDKDKIKSRLLELSNQETRTAEEENEFNTLTSIYYS